MYDYMCSPCVVLSLKHVVPDSVRKYDKDTVEHHAHYEH